MTDSIEIQIQNTFDQNRIDDLHRFMNKRKRLNAFNTFLMYAFHVVQSAGILLTTIAAGYNDKKMVLIGSGINALASLIHVFEKNNTTIMKKLLNDIKLIKAGTYVDEGIIDGTDEPPVPPKKKEEEEVPVSKSDVSDTLPRKPPVPPPAPVLMNRTTAL